MFNRKRASITSLASRLNQLIRWSGVVLLLAWTGWLQAGPIPIPNGSFEAPTTVFVTLNLDSWQRTPQPGWWDTNTSGDWTTLIGFFLNTPPGSFDHIENCHSNQAMWLFARPETGLFQDYDSMDWNDPVPTHAFNAKYEIGKAYQLKVGLLSGGMGSGGGVKAGATVDFILYYRDPASNRVTVAANTITCSPSVFSNSTHLLDFSVDVPTVRPGDAWANKNIGILLLSTVSNTNLEGGYWDLDNVRLSSFLAPTLVNPVRTNGQFQFTLQSEPGMAVEVLASTNATLSLSNWSSLITVTNVSGTIPLVDTNANLDQRFFQARLLP